jgi:D-alanine-D-alanine ligase
MTSAVTHHVGVICGGFSGERAVSLRSGANVAAALIRKGYSVQIIDPAVDDFLNISMTVAFIVLHGAMGEDGATQAILEQRGIPYTGSGVTASVIGMNKLVSKWMFSLRQIPTAPYQVISPDIPQVLELPLPVIIKPINEGSSLGIEIADTEAEFQDAAHRLTQKYGVCLVEALVTGMEVTVGVIDGSNGPEALPILELRPHNRIYDYEAKYTDGKTDFILPATLSDTMTTRTQAIAIATHQALGCRGMSRTDMIIHPDQGPYVLEVNTIPGMTDLSDLPAQARAAGLSFDDLVERILQSALG